MRRFGSLDAVRFEPAHALAIKLRAPDAAWVDNMGAPVEAQAQLLACGPAVTLFLGSEIVACGGVMMLWRDVAEVWMRTSPLVETHALALVRTVRWFLDSVWTDLALRRLQCVVRADYNRAVRFADRVGFRQEALLHHYGPDGADYLMCARLRGEKHG